MSTALQGRRFEHEIRKALEAAGFEVVRGAGSKGKFAGFNVDLIATKETSRSKGTVGIALLQAKWTKT